MPFLLLMFLYMACLIPVWPTPLGLEVDEAADPQTYRAFLIGATTATWLFAAMAVLFAWLIVRKTRQRLTYESGQRDQILRRYSTSRIYHLIGLFLVYGAALYGLGWGWTVQEVFSFRRDGEAILIPGGELIRLLPFLAALVGSWACFYDAERALTFAAYSPGTIRSYWSRWAYVAFHARQTLAMVLVPVTMLVLMLGLFRLFPEEFKSDWFPFAAFGLLLCVVAGLPWVVRIVLGLTALPEGPMRDRLLATGKRLNFRCSNILLWNTRSGVANAMVVGVFPLLRYVVFTDRLMEDLSPDEVDAVFGHEVGHVKHRHMLYYMGFLFISLAVLVGVGSFLVRKVPALQPLVSNEDWNVALLVSSLGSYIFVVFGFLSRRCERQADIYGCRAVSCVQTNCVGHENALPLANGQTLCPTGIRTFVSALEKVACLNGISRNKPGWLQSWQHSTIDRRVRFLQEVLANPALEPKFQRRVGIVKWAMMIALFTLFGILWSIDNQTNAASTVHPTVQQTESDQ